MPGGSPTYPPVSTLSFQELGKTRFIRAQLNLKLASLYTIAHRRSLSHTLSLALPISHYILLPHAREGAPSSRRLSCTSVPYQKRSQRAYARAPEKATKRATTATTARPNDRWLGRTARGGTPPYSIRTPFEKQLRGSRPKRRCWRPPRQYEYEK